jgi:hypothetical protein
VAPHADIIGLRVARAAETEEGIDKIGQPTHEERDHQPVDVADEVVNVLALHRGHGR